MPDNAGMYQGNNAHTALSAMQANQCLAREREVQICTDDGILFRTACTPEHIPEMVIGRLLTEGLVMPAMCTEQLITQTEQCRDIGSICVRVNLQKHTPQTHSPRKNLQWEAGWIDRLYAHMCSGMPLYRMTGSTHCCILMRHGEILCSMEDIGRHNAFDKVVGWAVLHGIPMEECVAFSSGRVPVDMVRKAVCSGVGVFAAKGLPTAEAAELARREGLTLLHRSGQHGLIDFTQGMDA